MIKSVDINNCLVELYDLIPKEHVHVVEVLEELISSELEHLESRVENLIHDYDE